MGDGVDAETWDVVVVGAGPAGATAALAALTCHPARRPRVLLLDRADFPRDKCCGDGIAPHVLDVLDGLGAGDLVDDWTPVRSLELARDDRHVRGPLARPTYVVPREVFDARLVERAVAAGAVLHRHRVRSVAPQPGTGLTLLDDTIAARVVIGADGAHSVVRDTAGVPTQRRVALALRGYVPTPPEWEGAQVIRYGDRRQPSYAWAFDRGDGLANVGYGELLDAAAPPPSRALLLGELERLLPGATRGADRWTGHHLPLSGWGFGRHQPDGPTLLVGDAAGLVNPMTGEGIYYAVATGRIAGEVAAHAVEHDATADAGARHRHAVRRVLHPHLHHTWAAARLSDRPRLVDAGIHAANHDRHAFDQLVELGLGDGRITPRLAAGLVRGLAAGLRPTRRRPPAPQRGAA